jgi:hypothetical protein
VTEPRDPSGRFRPGQTGNPNGRPRKHHGVDAAVTRALQEKITVTERGRRRRKSKLEVTAAQIANQGAGGDLRAAKLALDLAAKAEGKQDAGPATVPLTENDRAIVERWIARLKLTQTSEIDNDNHAQPRRV